MKIYNEVVIDMNPESPSYGETLHEDSYEYEGDMYLAQGAIPLVPFAEIGWENTGSWQTTNYTQDYAYVNGKYYKKGKGAWDKDEYHELSDNMRDAILANPDAAGITFEGLESLPGEGTFTYDESGEFDPTSEEFKRSVQETGDYSQILEGYGFEAGDIEFFDQPKMDELGYITEEYNIAKDQIGVGRDTLAENLRSARSSYGIGMESAGLQAGRSLAANKQRGDIARSRSGLATSGTINTQQKTAGKGIWQDYTQQQKTLSNQMTSAQSAFGIGQRGLDLDATRADLTKRRGESTFWEGLETDFYSIISDPAFG